ncbi:MAG TPA: sulfotransferase [Chthoniobacteraceae bacterium]|jgi:sulfotransferase|nr:sulfotransferase [Chthoniobacteraceae bacterium]
MKDKKLHFLCGLPRAGGTLLSNILAQNPRFHLTSPPGVLDLMFMVRRQWNHVVEFKATPNEKGKLRVLRGILENFYSAGGVTQPVIIDKSRAWLGMVEMAETLFETEAKIIVPVRDVRDVLASFEKIWRSNPQMRQMTERASNGPQWENVSGRCNIWLQGDQPIGLCFNRIKDAITRGYSDRLHFVDYDQLTRRPLEILGGLYQFLGEEPFDHDLENIIQVTTDYDEFYPVPNLPPLRAKLEPVAQPQWHMVLGAMADPFGVNNSVWKRFTQAPPDLTPHIGMAAPALA